MKRMQFARARVALTLAAGLGSMTAAADPAIYNGSFESPAYGAAGTYSGGADGWIESIDAPEVIVNGNIKDGNNKWYGVTPYGTQYLGMDVQSINGFFALESQTVSGFVAGQTYLITMQAADSDGGTAPKLEVYLSDGGSTVYLFRHFDLPVGGPYGGVIRFNPIRILFKSPVTGDVSLTLKNAGTDNDGSISIDNVAIATASSADTGTAAQTSTFVERR